MTEADQEPSQQMTLMQHKTDISGGAGHYQDSQDHHNVVKRSLSDAKKYLAPEKRRRFERTQDILAKSGLLDITKKTALLIKSNQQAQQELQVLRQEIHAFVQSVLANPLNRDKTPKALNDFLNNPLNNQATVEEIQVPSPKVSVIKQHPSTAMSHNF